MVEEGQEGSESKKTMNSKRKMNSKRGNSRKIMKVAREGAAAWWKR